MVLTRNSSTAAPADYQSWKYKEVKTATNTTFAGGVATGTAYEVPFSLYKNALTDFILLTEEELYQGIALAAHHTRNLAEGAGASCLRAAIKIRDRLKSKKVAVQMSGGNASAAPFNIQVNVMAPNYLYSEAYYPKAQYIEDPTGAKSIAEKVPVGRLGAPEEVGELLFFLVSGKSTFVTGQVIDFTGGWP